MDPTRSTVFGSGAYKHKQDIDLLDRVQRRATKVVREKGRKLKTERQ